MGGGGNSFTGYTIPKRLSDGGFGAYSLVSVESNTIQLTGFLQDEDGILGRTVTITMTFDYQEIKSTKIQYE